MFLFELCQAVGCKHPDFLELDADQIIDWEAFNSIKPIGQTRADFRAAMMCSTMVNLKRTKNRSPVAPIDFMPFLEKPKQTFHQMRDVIKRAVERA